MKATTIRNKSELYDILNNRGGRSRGSLVGDAFKGRIRIPLNH